MTWLRTPLPRGVPSSLFPDPESARELLQDELARPEYQEPLLERLARWFNELVDAARDATATSGGLSQLAALVLLALLVVGIAMALSRLRANPTPANSADGRLLGRTGDGRRASSPGERRAGPGAVG